MSGKICISGQLNELINQGRQVPVLLQSILDSLIQNAKEFISKDNGWTIYRYGKTVIYIQQATYAGATQDLNINFPNAVQINRVEQMWNDATAKDAAINVYPDASSTYYSILDSTTANTATSRIVQLGTEYKYAAGAKLNLHYANYTVGKILKTVVAVDEL